ncbi:LOW QUALITY PROTEIN: dynein regulatory complex protein 1 [Anthonomus grandis grandis]|uniref:LOW QUALITY PROTEIN: dynein regulatory complex protein 1 n=1 Tax=Anthonomus grandis grandis TaxID=2921223 RepID=UPI002165EC2F|nr:LOW QUALITY PROTEIN: dynein regulatory complex protein 1 [Anthonomus grandis grandis]
MSVKSFLTDHLTMEELEPQVTSSDPNERKLARRLRIERRWEALKKSKQNVPVDKSTLEIEKDDEIQSQIKKSADLLEKFLLEGEEYISNVRIANDSREVDRRENEGINKEKIFEKLEEEAQSAVELFQSIATKWSNIQKHNDPLLINEAIIDQKEKCDMLISQKDAIIAMLNDELKAAERQFTKDQNKQIEDINTLSERIEKQISFMRRAYRDELEILEHVVMQERKNLVDATDKKWEELFRKRQNQEVSNMNKKFEQVEEFNQKMGDLRLDFQEHFRETKIKLENDIEELQRQLEEIRALALLNSEKLDYNYQILKKREDENIIIKSQQKRRMNKLQDVINDLRRQISEYETSMSNKIKKYSDNIRKLHKSILDVEAKADHFAHVNDEKFHMLWEMNKNRVLEVLEKILDTDKVLYEQQMGLDWDPPTNNIIDKKTLNSYKVAILHVEPKFIHDIVTSTENKLIKVKRLSAVSQPGDEEELFLDEPAGLNYKKVLKHILTRISDKSGFLAEKRLKELLKGYMDDQKHLVRLDNVFTALGIQGTTYIDILFKHFQPYSYCPVCQGSVLLQSYNNMSKIESGGGGSQISSMFSRMGDTENFMIPELDEVMEAIRQPDAVVREIIGELVRVDDLREDPESLSVLSSESEMLEDICAISRPEISSQDKSRDKVKSVSSKRRVSGSRILDLYSCHYRHPLVISPVYVLKALREFVTAYYVKKVGVPTTGARLEKKRMTISRYLTEADIKYYWDKFKLNFGEDRVQLWDALLEGLKKYHEILKDRRTICDEVLKLRKENAELKRLLGNYIDHHSLMNPICAKDRNESTNK